MTTSDDPTKWFARTVLAAMELYKHQMQHGQETPEPMTQREFLLAHALNEIVEERMTGPKAQKQAASALEYWREKLPVIAQ